MSPHILHGVQDVAVVLSRLALVIVVILIKLFINVYCCVHHQFWYHTHKFKTQGLNCPWNQDTYSTSSERNKNKHIKMRKHQRFGTVLLTCFTDFDPFLLHSWILLHKPKDITLSFFMGFCGIPAMEPWEMCCSWQNLATPLIHSPQQYWVLQRVLTLSALSFTWFLSKDLKLKYSMEMFYSFQSSKCWDLFFLILN